MANVSQPDGGGGANVTADPPGRNGKSKGQTVRKGGFVWQWNGSEWSTLREVTAKDRDTIPPADVGLDKGYVEGRWARQHADDGDAVDDDDEGSSVPRDTSNPGTTPRKDRDSGGRDSGGGAGGGGGKETLHGIPDGGEIWKVGDEYRVVYRVPGSNPPVLLDYKFRDQAEANAISAGRGIDVSRTLSKDQFRKQGTIHAGPADLITNTSEHPWDRFRQDFNREVTFKPWLADPDFMAIIAKSILEGRQPSLSEVQSTEWYQQHTAVERQQLELYYGDRAEWKDQRRVAEDRARQALDAAGYSGGGAGRVADYLSRELMFGRIRDDADLAREVERLSNPLAQGAVRSAGFNAPKQGRAVNVDGEVFWRVGQGDNARDYRMSALEQAKFGAGAQKAGEVKGGHGEGRKGFGGLLHDGDGRDLSAVDYTERVRSLVRTWLGPALMQGWGERKIAEWGQRFTDAGANPQEAEDELVAKLRGIKTAHYKGYDPDLTYEDIAAIGRAQVMNHWGTRMDETDPLFHQVLQLNDEAQASQLLWEKGLERGVDKVTQNALSGLVQSMDGGVRRSVV